MISVFSARRQARLPRVFALATAMAVLVHPVSARAGGPLEGAGISLADALSRVATGDPSIAAAAARLQAADAAMIAAEARPLDMIGLDVEDIAGTGAYSPVDRAQTTAWYERTWERGGKRAARIGAARSELGVTAGRNRVRMLDLLTQVQQAWVEALAAEAEVPIAEQRLAVARSVAAETGRRVGRALDPLFAGERARTSAAMAQIALDQAREGARIARAALAAYWGGTADYSLEAEPFGRIDGAEASAGTVEANPDLAVLDAERQAAEARVRLAEAGNVADPAARLGLRHFAQGGDVALVVGGSIPLGARSANRGNLARAHAERLAAEAEVAVARMQAGREIERLQAERAAIATEVRRIAREVVPSAERAVALVRDGFARGGTAFTFLEVSQAQQALVDARSRRVELLRRYHLAGARLDRLTGRHAPLLVSLEDRP